MTCASQTKRPNLNEVIAPSLHPDSFSAGNTNGRRPRQSVAGDAENHYRRTPEDLGNLFQQTPGVCIKQKKPGEL